MLILLFTDSQRREPVFQVRPEFRQNGRLPIGSSTKASFEHLHMKANCRLRLALCQHPISKHLDAGFQNGLVDFRTTAAPFRRLAAGDFIQRQISQGETLAFIDEGFRLSRYSLLQQGEDIVQGLVCIANLFRIEFCRNTKVRQQRIGKLNRLRLPTVQNRRCRILLILEFLLFLCLLPFLSLLRA